MIGFARALAGIAIVVGLGSAALFVVMRSNPGVDLSFRSTVSGSTFS